MSDPVNCYVNYQDLIVVPDCPEAPGEHSHWLSLDTVDEEGNGTYVCDQYNSRGEPSGEEIAIHVTG